MKNVLELGNEAVVADVLAKVREASEHVELDALIEQQAQFGRRVTQKQQALQPIKPTPSF